MHRSPFFWLHIVAPIFVGGVIYLLFRPTNLLLFQPLKWLGVMDELAGLRVRLHPLRPYLPDWVIFALPNALWVYSMLFYLSMVWNGTRNGVYWMLAAWLMALGVELLQFFSIFPGTFSGVDLLLVVVAGGGSVWTTKKIFFSNT